MNFKFLCDARMMLALAASVSMFSMNAGAVELAKDKVGKPADMQDISKFCGTKKIKVALADGHGANSWRKIHCLDKPNSVAKRLENYEAHKAYLSSATIKMVISGPLLADNEETMIGSFFLIEAFNRQDPFYKADLWAQISIRPFNKRVDNRA